MEERLDNPRTILKKLTELRDESPRDTSAELRSKNTYMARARSLAMSVSKPAKGRLNTRGVQPTLTGPLGKEHRFAMKALISVAIALAIALSGFGVTAAAAQSSMPNDALYGLKVWTEDLRMALTTDPEKVVDLALNLANTRAEEITALTEEGVVVPEQVRVRLELHIFEALQAFTRVQGEAVEPTMLRIQDQLKTQEQLFLRLQEGNGCEDCEPLLTQTQEMVQGRLELFQQNQGDSTMIQEQIKLQVETELQLQTNRPEDAGNEDGAMGSGQQFMGDIPEDLDCSTVVEGDEYWEYCLTVTPGAGQQKGDGGNGGGKKP